MSYFNKNNNSFDIYQRTTCKSIKSYYESMIIIVKNIDYEKIKYDLTTRVVLIDISSLTLELYLT